MMFLAFSLLTFVSILSHSEAKTQYIEARWDAEKKTYNLFETNGAKVTTNAMAWGSFDNAINETGWSYLEVYTNASDDDAQQAYAAGLVEGRLTRDLIDMHWQNTFQNYCVLPFSEYCQNLQSYLNDNLAWIVDQITSKAESDPYWHQVELFLEQLSGLVDGYKNTGRFPSEFSFDITSIALLQVAGDLEDLEPLFKKKAGLRRPLGAGSCSALIKLLPGNEDLYAAHDTWSTYDSMLRIQKKYDFKYRMTGKSDEPIPGQIVTFSSYPGTLMSGDDFYITNSGLVAIETTIGNNNPELYPFIKPTNSVLEEIRNVVSNRLARSAKEWVDTFIRYNSGTYNNHWMIIDYKLFKAGEPLPSSGLLHVVETLPGFTAHRDVTYILANQTYWASYNIPFFPSVFYLSGQDKNVEKYGNWFTFDKSPRALIFRRDHNKVKDTYSMTKLMRYNDFTKDPLSRCNCTPPYSAENAISARCDLNPISGKYPFSALGHREHGGTDMKLTTSKMVPTQEFIGISSPAYDQVPAFQWSTSSFATTVPHVGHPDLWNFKPVQHKWKSRQ